MPNLAFIDCETTGLDRSRSDMWELAVIKRTTFDDGIDIDAVHHFFFDIWMGKADPMALALTCYYQRQKNFRVDYPNGILVSSVGVGVTQSARAIARRLALLLDGVHLVGAVTDFDAFHIEKFLRENGECPTWHYHLICVENLAAGKLGLQPPWKSDDLAKLLGVPKYPTKHRALIDAEWVRNMYDKVMEI